MKIETNKKTGMVTECTQLTNDTVSLGVLRWNSEPWEKVKCRLN